MLKSCSGVTYCNSSFNCLLPIGSKDQHSVHQFFDIDELEDEWTHKCAFVQVPSGFVSHWCFLW